jgi:hypothetical protein
MPKDTKTKEKMHSQHALLCLLGPQFQAEKWFEPVERLVQIKQKTLKHTPTQKLLDCLLGILCGIESVCQINTELAVDPAVSRAFGRASGADQSVIQQTLSASTSHNVAQLRQALGEIFQNFSQSYRHAYEQESLILDLDMTGLPCSSHYEGAEGGYFAGCKRGTKGRQLCRVSTAQYNEIVYEQLFPGNTGSVQFGVFKQVLEAALAVLGGAKVDKSRLILRLDGGYGTREIVNYLLAEGYQFVVKLHSGLRAKKLGKTVSEEAWQSESEGNRAWTALGEDGFYTQPTSNPLIQVGVRCPEQPGAKSKAKPLPAGAPTFAYSVLLVHRLVPPEITEHAQFLGQQLAFYDDRACIESASFRGDKQGLKLAKRRKKSLPGQEILILLSQLAHNFLIWVKAQVVVSEPRLHRFGTKRWVRDLLAIPGLVLFKAGLIIKVRLTKRHSLAKRFFQAFASFSAKAGISLILYET